MYCSGEKDKEVVPRFVVSPDNGRTFREDSRYNYFRNLHAWSEFFGAETERLTIAFSFCRLKQPESFGVGKLWMWFETPLQAEDHVTDIYQEAYSTQL